MDTTIALNKNSIDCAGVWWVTQALKSKARVKPRSKHLFVVHVKNNVFTATNAERLHQYKAQRLKVKDGFYKVAKAIKKEVILTLIDEDIVYPKFSDLLIPEVLCDIITGCNELGKYGSFLRMYTNIVRSYIDGITVDYDYVKDAMYPNDFFEAFVNNHDNNRPLILKNSTGTKLALVQIRTY